MPGIVAGSPERWLRFAVMSLRVVFVAVVATVIAGVLATMPGTAQRAHATPTTDLLVGDSVMAGMSSSARSSLPNHVFDAKVCRRLVSTSCSYRGVRPAPALQVIRAWSGVTNRAIVVAAGYNDGAIASAVDAVIAEARRQGVPHVVWSTYRIAGGNAGIYRSHNAVLWQKAQQYPELTIADWASYSAGRSSWVAADGLHLTSSGARAMAGLIGAVLAELPPLGPPPIDAGADACFPISGTTGSAAIVNLTPVAASGAGHGVVVPSDHVGEADASNVNYRRGTADPNVAVVRAGTDGRACFRNSDHATVHLVADQLAAIEGAAFSPASPAGMPVRRLDTRTTDRRIPAGGAACFPVDGAPGDAALVNLTPVGADAAGHGVLTSGADDPPVDASAANYRPGSVDPNLAVAPIGDDGRVCFHVSDGASVHLVADHLGTIDGDAFEPAGADGVPTRLIDTRRSGSALAPSARRCFAAGGAGGVAVVNLTPVRASQAGHGLLVGSDATISSASSHVNFRVGSADPNVALAPIGADGRVCFVNSEHATVHLVADLMGVLDADIVRWPSPDGVPVRRLDTRAG